MRLLSLLPLVTAALLPLASVDAAFVQVKSEPAFPLMLAARIKPPATSAARVGTRKKVASKTVQQKAVPAEPLPEPRAFAPPPAARIVPNGILSIDGPVQPIVSSGAAITPNGTLSIPNASAVVHLQPVDPATREAETAQLELAQFLYYDYPLQLRQMDSQITVTQAEIDSLQQRLVNYSRFDKFINNANPLFESQRLANVALVDAQQRLSNLQYQRSRLQQWLPVEIRRRQLELHRALAPVDPGPAAVPTAKVPAPQAPAPYDATFDDDKER
jgi:hypothetical protein